MSRNHAPRFIFSAAFALGLLDVRTAWAQCTRQEDALERCGQTVEVRREDCEDACVLRERRCHAPVVLAMRALGRLANQLGPNALQRRSDALDARSQSCTGERGECQEHCSDRAFVCSGAQRALDQCNERVEQAERRADEAHQRAEERALAVRQRALAARDRVEETRQRAEYARWQSTLSAAPQTPVSGAQPPPPPSAEAGAPTIAPDRVTRPLTQDQAVARLRALPAVRRYSRSVHRPGRFSILLEGGPAPGCVVDCLWSLGVGEDGREVWSRWNSFRVNAVTGEILVQDIISGEGNSWIPAGEFFDRRRR